MEKKKITIVSGSFILVVAVVAAVAVTVSHRNSTGNSSNAPEGTGELSTSTKAIQSICQPTDYKEACESNLQKVAGNATDPKDLVKAAFQVAIDHIKDAVDHSSLLKEAAKDPRTSDALHNCRELLDYAIGDLKSSFEELGGLDMTKIDKAVDNLKIWLSAAITYQETCLDGFENTTGDTAESMRKALKSSSELTSNTLAIIDEIGSVLGSFNIPFLSRRLLSDDGYPSWMSASTRRLLAQAPWEMQPDVTVAQDGSGTVKTINEALALIPKNNAKKFVIRIMAGVYKEQVFVSKSMTNVVMIGDGPDKTKITGSLNYIDGVGTYKTATVAVMGSDFIAKDIAFENSAGAAKHQAVALRVQSDRSVFYNCQMDGYQDTLYTHTMRQFYRDCTISGTIDFIFGDAAVIFQHCNIIVRKPLDNQQNIITAQGRKDRREATAIIIHNCTITADPEYLPFIEKNPTFLGRPWKEYSRTFYIQNYFDSLINPNGWLPWLGEFGLNTCFYAELDNTGPGADMSKRVKWRGVKKTNFNHAQKFTVEHFIQGSQWLPATGVPFVPGLLPMNEGSRVH